MVAFQKSGFDCVRTFRAAAVIRGQARHEGEPVVLHSDAQRLRSGCLVDERVEDIVNLGGVRN